MTEGDCLWHIAYAYYSCDYSRWVDIYEKNKEVIGENPDLLLPGTLLIIDTSA